MPLKSDVVLWPDQITARRSWSRYWEVQPPPFAAALPFRFDDLFVEAFADYREDFFPSSLQPGLGDTDHVSNLCAEKLAQVMGDPSLWANNIAEWTEGINRIAGASEKIGYLINAIRRRDLNSLLHMCNLRKCDRRQAAAWSRYTTEFREGFKTPSIRESGKTVSDVFLAFHFGWEPAVQDIGNAIDVLQNTDFSQHRIKASSEAPIADTVTRSEDAFNIYTYARYGKVSCRSGCKVRITNPNYHLANELGFTNPAAIAWEAVPYSFVIDWFTNVGQCVSAFTGFLGVETIDGWTTISSRTWRKETMQGKSSYVFRNGGYVTPFSSNLTQRFYVERKVGIVQPTLELKPFQGFSPVRGATALALLLQKL